MAIPKGRETGGLREKRKRKENKRERQKSGHALRDREREEKEGERVLCQTISPQRPMKERNTDVILTLLGADGLPAHGTADGERRE